MLECDILFCIHVKIVRMKSRFLFIVFVCFMYPDSVMAGRNWYQAVFYGFSEWANTNEYVAREV